MLIRLIKRIYYSLGDTFFYLKLYFIDKNSPLVFFDIDNTVANTWPSLNGNYKSEYERLYGLKAFVGLVKLIKDYQIKKYKVVFLTARDYRFFSITRRWLIKYDLPTDNLILVSSPNRKVKLLSRLSVPILLYDDFSYNHENGQIKFYDSVIAAVKNMQHVDYYGYDFLKKHQHEIF